MRVESVGIVLPRTRRAGVFTTAMEPCQGRLQHHFVRWLRRPLTEPVCRLWFGSLSSSGRGLGQDKGATGLPEAEPGDGGEDQGVTLSPTARETTRLCGCCQHCCQDAGQKLTAPSPCEVRAVTGRTPGEAGHSRRARTPGFDG